MPSKTNENQSLESLVAAIQELLYEIWVLFGYKKIILEIFMFEKSPNF